MTARRKKILYGTFALLITLLCLSVVHNAAIKDTPQKLELNIPQRDAREELINEEQNILQIPSDNENPNDLQPVHDEGEDDDVEQNLDGGHVFEPENIGKIDGLEEPEDQILQDIGQRSENENVIKHPEMLLRDVENQVGKINKLKFEKSDLLPGDLSEGENRGPPDDIFGVGERIIKEGKPLPLVRASNKIDAILDARKKDGVIVFGEDGEGAEEDDLDLDDLAPPDHLDAVRMEQDGHLNRNYKKEVFFGEHEEFENLSEDEMATKLDEIFKKVDMNNNGFITMDELEEWIILKTNEHFVEAKKENNDIFNSLDEDSDGFITWVEFLTQYLQTVGFPEADARKLARGKHEQIPLDIQDREHMIRFQFRWAEAEEGAADNKLTLAEFQAFRHPESSQSMLRQMVHDIMANLDSDKDGIVTEVEFIALPPTKDEDYSEMDRNWQKQRKKEFRTVIDTDHDGKVTFDELLSYVDPQNPNHAKQEARNLVELGDSDGDERLSLDEVMDNMDLFFGSKMVNTGLSFHDEF